LEVGQTVISNPEKSMKNGEKVDKVTTEDAATTEK
jgi:HlyD family secretion protein